MLVSWTEEEVSKYSWNPKLKSDIIKYNDLRELKPDDKRLVDIPGYQLKIMPNQSGVHLPVEVYGGDPTVFHTLRWTEVLDTIFSTEPNLHFTYFASFTGILRVFPAFPWREQSVDMFDVRRRSWYIQGSSVPKDLFILLDTSGSMTGQSLKLANLSAQKLIGALGVDDYFVVAHFPGAKDHVAPMIVTANNESEPICFNSFVQATRRNKLRLFYDLSTLKARGYSDFPASLKFAYEIFRNLTGSARGDRGKELRNKILVLMTDNAFVFDESVLSQLKQQKSNITTFIYSLGEPVGAAYEHTMKACATNDYYQYLPTVGAVSNLMKDFHDKSTQIRFGPKGSPLPTEVILHGASDVLHTNQYKGTGLMVSISMPVYNRTKKLQFLGLMGTELPIDLMMYGLPQSKLYPVGYAFVVNTNGYLVFHPSLIPEYTWLDDSPYLDFLDVELNVYGSKTLVRKKLIDNVRGSERIIDFIKVSDNIHTYVKPRLYSFTRLPNTDFSVAFVTPTDQQLYSNIPKSLKFAIGKDDSGNYLIDDVLIEKLIKKARIILPWKALDVYTKTNYHVFSMETDDQHALHHTDDDDDETKDEVPVDDEENTNKETMIEDIEQQSNASVSLENETMISSLSLFNNTFCANDTNCSLETSSLLKKRYIRSILPYNQNDANHDLVGDTSVVLGTTPTDIEKPSVPSSLPIEQTVGTTTLQYSKFAVSLSTASETDDMFQTTSDFDELVQTMSSDQTPTIDATSANIESLIDEVDRQSMESDSSSSSSTITTTTSTTTAFTNDDLIGDSTLDMITDKANVDDNSEGSAKWNQLINEQEDEIKNFLEKIQNINSNQSELLSQILLEIIIAEKDVAKAADSIKLTSPVRSRTIALNTGLIWTIPVNTNEQFYNELKYWPNSPIFQRVYDSHSLIFWVPLRTSEATTKPVDKSFSSGENDESSIPTDTSAINDENTNIMMEQISDNLLQTMSNPIIDTSVKDKHTNETDSDGKNSDIPNDVSNNNDKHVIIEIDELFEESSETPVNEDETFEKIQSKNQTIDNNGRNNTPLPVTIFTPITLTQGQNAYKAGVMGITLEPDYLSEQLNMIPECSIKQANKLCYILEDAANIIAVNNKSLYYQIGQFLGYVDPDLMNALLQNHVYGVLKDYDFEGTCYPSEDKLETTSPGIHPIPSILMYTQIIFNLRMWFDWLLTLGSVSVFITRAFITGMIAIIVSGEPNDDTDPQNKPYQCIELIHRYYSLNSELYDTRNSPINVGFNHVFQGFISCSQQRNRDWSVRSISGTNLLLIITDPIFDECKKKAFNERLYRDPVKDAGPDVCEASRNPRYRRQSHKWTLAPNDQETHKQCSRTYKLTTTANLMTTLLIITLRSLLN
ncbi:Voltage-dependent calcium channel subunit alpha-2/delta-2 [Schistosoma japonicum]|nr:Voltage-dependent calcium channel subunit alpha-2/delta-2 [Schistosoma japonicum]